MTHRDTTVELYMGSEYKLGSVRTVGDLVDEVEEILADLRTLSCDEEVSSVEFRLEFVLAKGVVKG